MLNILKSQSLKLFLVLNVALTAFAVADDAKPWKPAGEVDGVKVFTREKEGSDIREIQATAVIKAPPARVMKVLGDYNEYKNFMPYTKESRLLSKEGNVTFFYSYLALPVISDRDYALKLTDTSDVQGASPFYKVAWEPANDKAPPLKKSVIRVEINKGHWLLKPTNGGDETFATYYLFTDPAGAIPKFLVNKANKDAIPDLFRAIRKRVTDQRYN